MIFSVIVPIYNVEQYLSSCIESVLKQSFEDLELILVDDGSNDNCPRICDCYAQKDSRIKVIHKKNGGLVSARQAGISMASGDYVVNLDGDDRMADEMLENAYRIIADTKADIISFSYTSCFKNGLERRENEPAEPGMYQKNDMKKVIYPKLLLDKNMRHMLYFLWGKAVRRSLITMPQLNVTKSISLGEDLCCVVPCYLKAEKVYITRANGCMYNIRDNSISKSVNPNQLSEIEEVVKLLHMLDSTAADDFGEQISRYYCFMCFAIIAAAAERKQFKNLKKIKKVILESSCKEELAKANFGTITLKSGIAVWLIKKKLIKTAFCFLYLCGCIKDIIGK